MKTLSARRIARHFFCFPVRLLIATVQADREIVRPLASEAVSELDPGTVTSDRSRTVTGA